MKKRINGVEYAYEIKGEGPPLLLLHGFTGSKATWAPFIPIWSSQYQTIAVDIIGHGDTESPEKVEPYMMPAVADALQVLLHDHGITKTHVLGYSMGGRLALYLAMTHPELIDGVLLESASPGLATPEEREARVKHDIALANDIIKKGIRDFVDQWEKIPLFKTQEKLPESVKRQIRNERLSQNPQGLANSLKGMGTGAQPHFWDMLSQCQKRVMLVVGSLDEKFVRIAEQMEKQLPQAYMTMINGIGHAPHVETPEFFGKIVMDDFYRLIDMKG